MPVLASHLILSAINASFRNLAALKSGPEKIITEQQRRSNLQICRETGQFGTMLSSPSPNDQRNMPQHYNRITKPAPKKTAIRSSRTRGEQGGNG